MRRRDRRFGAGTVSDDPDPSLFPDLGDLSSKPPQPEAPTVAPPSSFHLDLEELEPGPALLSPSSAPHLDVNFEADLGVGLWTVIDRGCQPPGQRRYGVVPVDHETVVENKKRGIPPPGFIGDGEGCSFKEALRMAKDLERLTLVMES